MSQGQNTQMCCPQQKGKAVSHCTMGNVGFRIFGTLEIIPGTKKLDLSANLMCVLFH